MAKLGIDLGTSNSVAAVLFENDRKKPVTVEPIDGTLFRDLVFPSYVAFDKRGKVSAVGLPARERYLSGQSELVVRHFKRLIGRPYDHVAEQISKGDRAFSEFKDRIKRADDGLILVTVGERDVSVIEIASYLLRKIFDDTQLLTQKWGEDIDAITISLPAGFDDSQRQATMEAARIAGLSIDMQVIEEPTAAAIMKGVGGVEGSIMVIDVGAGTTDVVIGHVETTEDGLRLVTTTRECDDTLGGIDMDNLILDHVARNDAELPRLCDILPDLGQDQTLPLMGKIEEAKISASHDGHGHITRRLVIGPEKSKQVDFHLERAQLAGIVAPVINGYTDKGDQCRAVRTVVESALLKAASNKPTAIPQVTRGIISLILVGGPCRMENMRKMLQDVFRDNENIVRQLDDVDPEDRFFMEGVAQGTALSQAEGTDVTTTLPHSLSIFCRAGTTLVIAEGTPYKRVKGISRSVSIPADEGSNLLWILSQKESKPTREWSMHSHIVNVPQTGDLKVTLDWCEGGAEADKITVEGCSLPGRIKFPQTSNTASLGPELEDRFQWYLAVAKDLPRLVKELREPLVRDLVSQGQSKRWAEEQIDGWLQVSEPTLQRCEAIEPDKERHLTEAEIELALNKGHFEMRDQVATTRGLLSPRGIEVLDLVLRLLWRSTGAEELIVEAKNLLNTGQNCADCSSFCQQLAQWLHGLERNHNDIAVGSATATSLGALADCLYSKRAINEEEFNQVQNVCWRFDAGG